MSINKDFVREFSHHKAEHDLRMAELQRKHARQDLAILVMCVLVVVFVVFLVPAAEAQETWVICESPLTGAQSVFKGSCPQGWVFVDVA